MLVETQPSSLMSNREPIAQMRPIDFSLAKSLKAQLPSTLQKTKYRFYRVKEIPEEKSGQYRLAMANVLSGLRKPDQSMVYVLSGNGQGVALYLGVASDSTDIDIYDEADSLASAFEGNFLGAQLEEDKDNKQFSQLTLGKHLGLISGVPSFNEDDSAAGGEDVQGIERLVNSLLGETWQLVIVAQAIAPDVVRQQITQLYDLSTELSQHIKLSVQQSENKGWNLSKTEGKSDSITVGDSRTETRGRSSGTSETKGESSDTSKNIEKSGKSSDKTTSFSSGKSSTKATNDGTNESIATGTSNSNTLGNNNSDTVGRSGGDSTSLSRERMNKQVESLHQYINDTLLGRYYLGQTKGFFKTAIYVSADTKAVYDRLANGVLSLFQGNQVSMVPMQVHKLASIPSTSITELLSFKEVDAPKQLTFWQENALLQGMPIQTLERKIMAATAMTTRELTLVAGMPSIELPGLKIRKSVDFAVNVPETSVQDALPMGGIVQHGRDLSLLNRQSNSYQVALNKKELNKHTFVCGVTGSGKTTTCMRLLLESGLPFLVIEPAKTEYRALFEQNQDIEYYAIGREDLTIFRLNPFELVKGEQLQGHIQMLNATLAAVFPMEAAMPYMVEEAIIMAYKNKGWDTNTSENYLVDDPWQLGLDVWPTFSDMISALDAVILSKGLGTEFEQKYRGSLVARFTNLTLGTKGRMLNTRHSLDFDQLLDKKVVIELEEIKDEQDKALLMGLILVRLAESMKHRHRKNKDFQHLTLVEEAHRLLSRVEPGDPGSKKAGVEMFANLLAEVRKYGEGLIIADQIPNKLVPDVMKNTNTKIVHRLFAADDRDAIGDTMSLNDEQKDFLPLLKVGEAIIYSGGWHAPVWVKVRQSQNTTGQPIDETLIQQRGVKQLWQQRKVLFPALTKTDSFNEQQLSSFVRDGLGIINRVLKLLSIRTDSNKTDEFAQIYAVVQHKMQHCLTDLATDKQQLSNLLTALFMDVAMIENSDGMVMALTRLFETMLEDQQQVHLLFDNSNRAIKIKLENDAFKNIQSL